MRCRWPSARRRRRSRWCRARRPRTTAGASSRRGRGSSPARVRGSRRACAAAPSGRRGRRARRGRAPAGDVGDRLGEELVVAAVRTVHGVRRAQADDRADRAALLPDARVRGAVHEALAGEFEHGLLEGADEVELAEHRRQQRRIGVLPVLRRWSTARPRAVPVSRRRRCGMRGTVVLDCIQSQDNPAVARATLRLVQRCNVSNARRRSLMKAASRACAAPTTSVSPCPTSTRRSDSWSTSSAPCTSTRSARAAHDDDWMDDAPRACIPAPSSARSGSTDSATVRTSRSSSTSAADGQRPQPRNSDIGGHHLALYVDDLDAAVAYLRAARRRDHGRADGERQRAADSAGCTSAPLGHAVRTGELSRAARRTRRTRRCRLWHPANPAE